MFRIKSIDKRFQLHELDVWQHWRLRASLDEESNCL